jgi:hypothetical protein
MGAFYQRKIANINRLFLGDSEMQAGVRTKRVYS